MRQGSQREESAPLVASVVKNPLVRSLAWEDASGQLSLGTAIIESRALREPHLLTHVLQLLKPVHLQPVLRSERGHRSGISSH